MAPNACTFRPLHFRFQRCSPKERRPMEPPRIRAPTAPTHPRPGELDLHLLHQGHNRRSRDLGPARAARLVRRHHRRRQGAAGRHPRRGVQASASGPGTVIARGAKAIAARRGAGQRRRLARARLRRRQPADARPSVGAGGRRGAGARRGARLERPRRADRLHRRLRGRVPARRHGGDGHYDQGFHATGTVGTFGAAAGAANLLGLDAGEDADGARHRGVARPRASRSISAP